MKRLTLLVSFLFLGLASVGVGSDPAKPPPPPHEKTVSIRPPTEPPRELGIERASPAVPHPAERSAFVPGVAPVVVHMKDIPAATDWEEGLGSFAHVQGDGPLTSHFVPGDGPPGLEAPFEPRTPDLSPGGSRAAGDFVYGFDGISYTGWFPPDTILAVGRKHIIEAVNSHWIVYSKLGNAQRTLASFSAFLDGAKPAGWQGFFFDPRVIFDVYRERFVMAVLGLDEANQKSYCFLCISQTADPNGSWWIWRLHHDWANAADADAWWDYQSLGADEWGVYLTGNYFYWVGGNKYSIVWSITPDVFNGAASDGRRFWNLTWPAGGNAFSLQMAEPHSYADGEETFFVNSYSGDGNQICLWTLTGNRATTPTLVRSAVATANYYWIGQNVDQPGSSTDIDGGDARIMNAVYAQRRLYTVLTTDPLNNLGSSGPYTMKVNVDTATLEWGDILYGPSPWYYFYPAVTIDAVADPNGNLGLSMSFAKGDEHYVGGLFKAYTNQPTDGSGPFWGTATGQAPYVRLDGSDRNRWGDYSGQVYDWASKHFWGAIEFAGPSDTWKTRITAAYSGAEPAFGAIDLTYPNGGETFSPGDSFWITWDKLNLNPAHNIFIFYNDGNGWHDVAGPLPTTNTSQWWTVPNLPSTNGWLYIGVWDGGAYPQDDWTDGPFVVVGNDHIFSNGFESGNTSGWS